MNKLKIYIYLFSGVLLLSSCGSYVTSKVQRTTSFSPTSVELKLTLSDFEYIGEVEVTVSYNRYIGLFTHVHEINGKEVARRNVNVLDLYGRMNIPVPGVAMRALYESHVKYPDAEFIVPTSTIYEEQKMFLGRKGKVTLKAKAYKFKNI